MLDAQYKQLLATVPWNGMATINALRAKDKETAAHTASDHTSAPVELEYAVEVPVPVDRCTAKRIELRGDLLAGDGSVHSSIAIESDKARAAERQRIIMLFANHPSIIDKILGRTP